MSATEAARNFSAVLNRVAAGEEIDVIRNGARVAVISPAKDMVVSAARFRELIATAPRPDDGFAGELRAARRSAEAPKEAWPS